MVCQDRQVYGDPQTRFTIVGPDATPHIGNRAVCDGQAKTGPLARRLGSEERLKQVVYLVLISATTRIFNHQLIGLATPR